MSLLKHSVLHWLVLITLSLNFLSEVYGISSGGAGPIGSAQVNLGNKLLVYAEGGGGGCTDSDGDGVCNSNDNCVSVVNPSQQNSDGDTLGDACDVDDDGDGAADLVDNCPLTYNPDQSDLNGNGAGFACDSEDTVVGGGVSGPGCSSQAGEGRFNFEERYYLGDISGDTAPDFHSVVSIALADVDGNGKADLVGFDAAPTTRGLKVLLNWSVAEQLQSPRYSHFSLPTNFDQPEVTVKVANLDGIGGTNDLVVTFGDRNFGTSPNQFGQLAVFRNLSVNEFTGQVSFTVEPTCSNQQYCIYATGRFPRSFVFADLNTDGWLDIVTANEVSDTLTVRLNQTPSGLPGKFGAVSNINASTLTGFSPASDKMLALAASDMNCDGRDDLVVSYQRSGGGGYVALLMNSTIPGSNAVSLIGESVYGPEAGVYIEPIALVVSELNDEAGPELIVGSRLNLIVSVIGNDRCGGESENSQYLVAGLAGAGGTLPVGGIYQTPIEPWSVSTGDFDDDGDKDLAISSGTSPNPRVTLLQNVGGGALESNPMNQQTFCLGAQDPQPLATGDFNGDSIDDIGIAFRGAFSQGGGIGLMLNGGPTLSLPMIIPLTLPAGTSYSHIEGFGINNAGDVVGTIANTEEQAGTLGWQNGFIVRDSAMVTPIERFSEASELLDINDNNQVVGGGSIFTYNGSSWTESMPPYGTGWSVNINNAGMLVGAYEEVGTPEHPTDISAFQYHSQSGVLTVLDPIIETFYGNANMMLRVHQAININESGFITGVTLVGSQGFRGFVLNPVSNTLADLGIPSDTPFDPATYERMVWSISDENESGKIYVAGNATRVEACDTAHIDCCFSPPLDHCYDYQPILWEGTLASGFTPHKLPKPSGMNAYAAARNVNEHGIAIGYATESGEQKAVLWQRVAVAHCTGLGSSCSCDASGSNCMNWVVHELNTVLEQVAPSEANSWNLLSANALNNNNQLTGAALYNGNSEPIGYRLSLPAAQ